MLASTNPVHYIVKTTDEEGSVRYQKHVYLRSINIRDYILPPQATWPAEQNGQSPARPLEDGLVRLTLGALVRQRALVIISGNGFVQTPGRLSQRKVLSSHVSDHHQIPKNQKVTKSGYEDLPRSRSSQAQRSPRSQR